MSEQQAAEMIALLRQIATELAAINARSNEKSRLADFVSKSIDRWETVGMPPTRAEP